MTPPFAWRYSTRNAMIAMTVGSKAPTANHTGMTPPSKNRLRIDWPAGFGALAMTVNPPPVTAPSTTATFRLSLRSGTSVAS